jgi:uncharacterized membrane protein
MFSDQDLEFFRRHRGKIFIAAVFLVLGVLFSTIGFLKTIFVLFLAIIGYFVGRVLDDPEALRRFISTYLNR